MRSLAIVALLLAPSIPRPTGACSPLATGTYPHTLDAAFASDTTAPSVTVSGSFSLIEDSGENGGGGCGTVDCGNGGNYIAIQPTATDDQTPAARIGYRFAIAAGQPPQGLDLPATAVGNDYGAEMLLPYYGAPGAPFSFDLEIRAVDLNGNVGPATVITISNPA